MNKLNLVKNQNILFEILNSISHGLGAIVGIVFLVLMCIKGIKISDNNILISYIVYGSCFILMFLSSAIYHATVYTKLKDFFRIFDHSAIFFFIAGSYTPIIIKVLEGNNKILFLSIIWIIATLGFLFKLFTYGNYDKYIKHSILIYVLMGWIAVFLIKPMLIKTPIEFFYCILAGGLLYTIGTYFYKQNSIITNHLIWHFFVLAAAICQFVGIYVYL